MHLFRRKNQTDLEEVAAFVEGEMAGTGQLQGYRWMHQRAIQRGFVVSQETIRLIIKILDSEGVELRRRESSSGGGSRAPPST